MDRTERPLADRRRPDGPTRTDLSPVAEQTGAAGCTGDTRSVRLLAAHEHHQDVSVLSVRGEIDLRTAPGLREALLPVLERETGSVVVDLSDVPFMDSTGVHVLVDTLRRLKSQNRRLAIACCEGGQVHRLLALVGLLDSGSVHRSRESAMTGGHELLRSGSRWNRPLSEAQIVDLGPPSINGASHPAPRAS